VPCCSLWAAAAAILLSSRSRPPSTREVPGLNVTWIGRRAEQPAGLEMPPTWAEQVRSADRLAYPEAVLPGGRFATGQRINGSYLRIVCGRNGSKPDDFAIAHTRRPLPAAVSRFR
jgi:hypothetical protein